MLPEGKGMHESVQPGPAEPAVASDLRPACWSLQPHSNLLLYRCFRGMT